MAFISNASQIRKYRPLALKDILKIANQVRRKYISNDGSLSLMAIANAEGIHIFRNSLVSENYKLKFNELAKIYYDPSQQPLQWMIIYDDSLPYGKRRFSVAHELGHYFLDHRAIFYETGIKTTPEIEDQADLFATSISLENPQNIVKIAERK